MWDLRHQVDGRGENIYCSTFSRRKTKKSLIDSEAILNTAIVSYYFPIRLKGLLVLQSACGPVSREKVLYISPSNNSITTRTQSNTIQLPVTHGQ